MSEAISTSEISIVAVGPQPAFLVTSKTSSDAQASPADNVSEKSGSITSSPTALCASEEEWQTKLVGMFGGGHATCSHKKIADVVTNYFLIEIKKAKDTEAWGVCEQLEHYVDCFPGRRNILFVFGNPNPAFNWKRFIEKIGVIPAEVRFEIPPPGFEDHLMLTSEEIATAKEKAIADAKDDEFESRRFKVSEGINMLEEFLQTLEIIETKFSQLIAAKTRLREVYEEQLLMQIDQKMDNIFKLRGEHKKGIARAEKEDEIINEYFDKELVFGESYSIPSKELDLHYYAWTDKVARASSYNIYRQALYRHNVVVKRVDAKMNGKPVRGSDGKSKRITCLVGVAIKPQTSKDKSQTQSSGK